MGEKVLIEVQAWWLLMVPLLLMLSLLLIALIMRNSSKKKKEVEEKSLTSWIEIKDILYWSLIVFLGAIAVFTFQYKSHEDVISHWGFAGTIVSIILAVIAIGFTLFQTLTHSLSSEKIEKSAERIEKASTELDSTKLEKASEIITNTSKNIAEFNTNVEDRLKEMTEEITTLKDVHLNNNSKIESLLFNKEENEFEGNENGIQSEKSINIDLESFFEKEFPRMPAIPRFFLYCVLALSETGILLNKKNRGTIITKVTDLYMLSLDVEDDSKSKKMMKRTHTTGANFGSLGAVRTLVIRLGILNAYKEKDEPSRLAILENARKSIAEKYILLLEQFIEEVNE